MSKTIIVESEQDITIVSNVCNIWLLKEKKFVVTLKKEESLSDKQRKLYFLWIGVIAPEIGNTKDEQHTILKREYLLPICLADIENHNHDILREGWANLQIVFRERPELYQKLFNLILEGLSITNASITNMREYLIAIDDMAHWQGIKLPYPDDCYFEAMGIKKWNSKTKS